MWSSPPGVLVLLLYAVVCAVYFFRTEVRVAYVFPSCLPFVDSLARGPVQVLQCCVPRAPAAECCGGVARLSRRRLLAFGIQRLQCCSRLGTPFPSLSTISLPFLFAPFPPWIPDSPWILMNLPPNHSSNDFEERGGRSEEKGEEERGEAQER